MDRSSIDLNVRLGVAVRQDGNAWLAWCPPLDVMTQAETQQGAIHALKGAVQLWFESCIQRGVLEEALKEAGFNFATSRDSSPPNTSVVEFQGESSFREVDQIEVSIPAYIAAQQIDSRATR